MSKFITTFNTHAEYEAAKANLSLPNVSACRDVIRVAHYEAYDPYARHEYVEIAGMKWATMNIGATTITEPGYYIAWADPSGYTSSQVGSSGDKKAFTWADYIWSVNGSGSNFSKYNSSDSKVVVDIEDDAARAYWGGAWRTPTKEEYDSLASACNFQTVNNYQGSGVNGLLFTHKTDSTKTLFFPCCGDVNTGSIGSFNANGRYWTSTLQSVNNANAWGFRFNTNNWKDMNVANRYIGRPIRAIIVN